MEAYNRLSLLLDQQKPSSPEIESNIPFKSENNKKKSTTLENKIDILTNLIAVDHTKESQNLQTSYPLLNESAHSIGTHHSFGVDKMEFNGNNEKNITSKNILPHMDDLITVLVDNNIASHDINDLDQNKIYNSPSKPQAEKNGGKKLKMHTIKARKYDAFAIFKVNFAISVSYYIFTRKRTQENSRKLSKDSFFWKNSKMKRSKISRKNLRKTNKNKSSPIQKLTTNHIFWQDRDLSHYI
jgi:hypothetical protein